MLNSAHPCRFVVLLQTCQVDFTIERVSDYIQEHNHVRPYAVLLVEDGLLPRTIEGAALFHTHSCACV